MNETPWVLTHWPAVWGLVIYFYRLIHDLCFGGGLGRENKLERVKNIGQDLYWISIVLWGLILLNLNSKPLASYLGKGLEVRVLVLIGILVMGQLISKLRNWGEDFTGRAPKTRARVMATWALFLVLHIIGAGSLLYALLLIGK